MHAGPSEQIQIRPILAALTAAAVLGIAPTANGQEETTTSSVAQDDNSPDKKKNSGANAAIETIRVTGTKKRGGQDLLAAPTAVTAYGESQLDAFQFRDVESLTFAVPNVSLDSVGTVKGVANFSMRGLGSNSSIPSIDPTVGLFVNGVYFGSTAGAVLDSFDLEAVEVLRGPQGVLFGRNVTGGAVLLRTKRPGDKVSASIKANVETGFEYRLYGAFDAPILEDTLLFRMAAQYRNDSGWFTNEFDGEQFGEEETFLIRPTVTFMPTDDITLHVMYEHGETDGQGPASQNSARATEGFQGPFRDFEFSINEPGNIRYVWNQVFAELNWDLGDAGNITDIFGYRTVTSRGVSDIDSSPLTLFHANVAFEVAHWSNELRYNNLFFNQFLDFTVGLYAFGMDLDYDEGRLIPPVGLDADYGGEQGQLSLGAFTQFELNFTDDIVGIVGTRVTYEEKDADIATLQPSCFGGQCEVDLSEDNSWLNVSPKVGFRWAYLDRNNIYGHWTRGFRGGGYNMRRTSTLFEGGYDEEQQDAFELGAKGSILNNRLRYGLAGFFYLMSDMQRELNLVDPTVGVVQVVRNTADANVYGFEFDAQFRFVPNAAIFGSFGYTDADYTSVREDLNSDGMIDGADEDLTLPRLANITANLGAIVDVDMGVAGLMTIRFNYAYRDTSFFTDNNQGLLPSGDILDASIALTLPDIDTGGTVFEPTVTLYGRNLLQTAFLGGQTPLPFGSNFSPLKEGRALGVEVKINWL